MQATVRGVAESGTTSLSLSDSEVHLLVGKKVITNLESIFKSRDITLSTKVRLVKAVVFAVVM